MVTFETLCPAQFQIMEARCPTQSPHIYIFLTIPHIIQYAYALTILTITYQFIPLQMAFTNPYHLKWLAHKVPISTINHSLILQPYMHIFIILVTTKGHSHQA